MAAHAKLSGSKTKQWLACPASVRLQAGRPNVTGMAALEGTAAHTVAENCLLAGGDAAAWIGRKIEVTAEQRDGSKRALQITVSANMADAVQVYLDHVRPIIARSDWHGVEVKLARSLEALDPDLGGTADLVALNRAERVLYVRDYKHGVGVTVDPTENAQALTYGLGAALLTNVSMADFDVVDIGIVQPRAAVGAGVKTWRTDVLRLLEWGATLQEGAARTRDPAAPAVAGEHCQFCLASAECKAHYERALNAAGITAVDFYSGTIPRVETPDRLSPSDLSQRLKQAAHLKRWIASLEAFALAEAVEGRPPDGFKAVAGRGSRVFRDTATAIKTLSARFDLPEDSFFKQEPLSVAQCEKLLGKKALKTAADLWEGENRLWKTEPGKPALAPADDPRPAYDKSQMFDVVGDFAVD